MAKKAVPNILAFGNLACGMISILMLLDSSKSGDSYYFACFFIILAAAIHRYGMKIAKFLNVLCEMEKELNALSDLVSFGVAPSILIYNLNNHFSNMGIIGYLLGIIFPLAGAYRLARYRRKNFDDYYLGISITLAGVFMTLYSLIVLLGNSKPTTILSIMFIILLSYLMVSKFKIRKL